MRTEGEARPERPGGSTTPEDFAQFMAIALLRFDAEDRALVGVYAELAERKGLDAEAADDLARRRYPDRRFPPLADILDAQEGRID